LCAACSTETAPQTQGDTTPELRAHQSPVVVSLRGPAQVEAGQVVELVAQVQSRAGRTPIALSLRLPEGAQLVSGESAEELHGENGTLVRRYLVRINHVPSQDVEAVATASGESFGARASAMYRFGRAEPRFAGLPRATEPLRIAGKSVGRPVLLEPK